MFLTNIYDDMKKKKNRYISEPKLNSLTKNSLNSVLNLLPALEKATKRSWFLALFQLDD